MAVLIKTIDFGSTPVDGATLVVNDAGFSGQTYIEAFIMSTDTTVDNDAPSHMQLGHASQLVCSAPSGSDVTLDVHLIVGLVTGTFKVRFATSP